MKKSNKNSDNSLVTNKLISEIIGAAGYEEPKEIDHTEVLTSIPALNIALGGSLTSGLDSGITELVGDSMTFKTLFMLIMAKGYLETYPDAFFVLFDTEGGASEEYFRMVGVPQGRYKIMAVRSVEEVSHKANAMLDKMERGTKFIFALDSLGMAPSRKEKQDSIDQKETKDMSRAGAVSSLFRTLSMELRHKEIPFIIINHHYADIAGGPYAANIIKGGKNATLAPNTILTITKAAERDKDKTLIGHTFNLRVYKSRKCRPGVIIPVTVLFEGGVDKYSALLDIAIDGKFIKKPNAVTVSYNGAEAKTTSPVVNEWLEELLDNQEFKDYVEKTYRLVGNSLFGQIDQG